MMSLTLMMFPSEMMSALPNVLKQTSHHCETKCNNIIFAKQMHHIAIGDASLKYADFYDIITRNGGGFYERK